MQKIWVCGARGQIGQAVNDVVDKLEFEMLDTDVDDLDVTDTDEVLRFGEMNRPDIIINCSGMTDISSCEENPSQAFKVNALGARNLAIVAKKMQAKMVQLSTDDVFDGKSTEPYTEFDITNPGTVYGKSSLRGKLCERIHNKTFYRAEHLGVWKGTEFYQWFLKKWTQASSYRSPLTSLDHRQVQTNWQDFYYIWCIQASTELIMRQTRACRDRYAFAQEILKMTGKTASMRPVPTVMSDFQGETGVCGAR